MEFALDDDPANLAPSGKLRAKIAPVGGVDALTLTLPVRNANPYYESGGGEHLVIGFVTPYLHYLIQASDDLLGFVLDVDWVQGADATAIQTGLPPLSPGWLFYTFRSPGPVAGDPSEFMRLGILEAPLPSP